MPSSSHVLGLILLPFLVSWLTGASRRTQGHQYIFFPHISMIYTVLVTLVRVRTLSHSLAIKMPLQPRAHRRKSISAPRQTILVGPLKRCV